MFRIKYWKRIFLSAEKSRNKGNISETETTTGNITSEDTLNSVISERYTQWNRVEKPTY